MIIAIVFYGPGLLILRPQLPKAQASALSFICANSAAATSTAACTGEAAGDLLLIMCGETTGGASPTLPTGVTAITGTNIVNTAGSTSTRTGMNAGWITAANSSSGSGTCGTGTTDTVMMVYRGQAASPIGANVGTESGSNSGTTVSFNADTLTVTDGSSWFAALAIRNTADAKMATAPTGMTNRTKIPSTTPAAAGHDLNGPTSSNWSLTSVTGFSASAKYTSVVLEIKAAPNITVGTAGTQVSTVVQGSTANYIGGAFTFIRDVGTANITSITISETGTINATSNLSNLILFYKQEAVCSTSIPSGTTQFNSTGGSFVSEASTVTGTIAVSTSQICVYAQVDVGSGANVGDTIDFEITNPSTDTIASAGTTSPSSAVAISGTTSVVSSAPATDQLLRGGEYFSAGVEQPFYWAK